MKKRYLAALAGEVTLTISRVRRQWEHTDAVRGDADIMYAVHFNAGVETTAGTFKSRVVVTQSIEFDGFVPLDTYSAEAVPYHYAKDARYGNGAFWFPISEVFVGESPLTFENRTEIKKRFLDLVIEKLPEGVVIKLSPKHLFKENR